MTSAAIKQVLREGEVLNTPSLRLYYRNCRGPTPELACVVGKKVHAQAVVRHRYQRLLREAGRAILKSHSRYDMVMVAKPEITQLKKLQELQAQLQPHLEKLSKEN